MHIKNVDEIVRRIKDADIVLDIGGWFRPFNRADWVIDIMPYETRGAGGCDGTGKEYFSKQRWLQIDACDRKPLPFKDKEIDFVICSHTLEDIRDPVYLCSEICRVGKRGYIEVPSRLAELSFGVESRNYAGYVHHRWIIDIEENKITFLIKPLFIHLRWKYHFPSSYGKRLAQRERVQWLFWDYSFKSQEQIKVDWEAFQRQIEGYISLKKAHPRYRYKAEEYIEFLKRVYHKIITRILR